MLLKGNKQAQLATWITSIFFWQLYQIANLCLVAQRINIISHSTDASLSSSRLSYTSPIALGFTQHVRAKHLEWIYNTREMNAISFNSLHQISTSPAPSFPSTVSEWLFSRRTWHWHPLWFGALRLWFGRQHWTDFSWLHRISSAHQRYVFQLHYYYYI